MTNQTLVDEFDKRLNEWQHNHVNKSLSEEDYFAYLEKLREDYLKKMGVKSKHKNKYSNT